MERTKHGEFNWVDLSTRDFEAQSRFYEALFGWARLDMNIEGGMVYRLFKAGEHSVAGAGQLPPEMIEQGMRLGWGTCVTVDDVDRAAAKAAELGGMVVMPPMDVPGPGRQALVQDPTGGQIFLWKPATPDATLEYLLPGRLSWNELSSRDPERAAAFYSALLGWEIEQIMPAPRPYWQVKVDGEGQAGIAPMAETAPADAPASWLVYFGAEDVESTVARAAELGAVTIVPPTEVPGMLVLAVLADPAGASFGVLHGFVETR